MAQRKFIIDCDAGTDDAFAIMLALSQPDIDVLAITCAGGNIALDKVCVNVMKVLEVCGRTDIPVYNGASSSLMGGKGESTSFIFGEDGFGDAEGIPDPDLSRIQEEHAVNAIIRLARQHPGEITLAAVAPVKNLALACRMDPTLPQNLKRVVIMGGNDEGSPAEFNFKNDVESAAICLKELTCPVYLATFEACFRHSWSWEFYDDTTGQGTEKANFFRKIDSKSCDYYKNQGQDYVPCDLLAMAVAVKPDIVEEETRVHATVKLNGENRGQMVYDGEELPNLIVVKRCNMEAYKQLASNSLK